MNENILDLSKISNEELLFRLEKLARTERKLTHVILCHINEVDSRKLYLDLGFESLYKYLTKHLGYAESSAYDRLQAARILKQIPEVAEKIEEGSLNLSQLVKVDQCLKQEKKQGNIVSLEQTQNLLSQIENKNSFETEKVLSIELNYTPKTYQKIEPQRDGTVFVSIPFSPEDFEALKEVQSLLSHIIPENDLAKVIAYMTKAQIQKMKGKEAKNQSAKKIEIKDNIQVDETLKSEPKKSTQSFRVMPKNKRKYISVKVKRAVFARANHCCELVHSDGKRCQSKFQLQTDHIIPLACGGTNDFENLRLLCGIHNRSEAERWGLSRPH
jgi:hypothetical protein